MKFCSKCGKEIMDEAAFCPYCGCTTELSNKHSEEHEKIVKFEEDLKSPYMFSIIALVLSLLGVGGILAFIITCVVAGKKLALPVLNNPSPEDKISLIKLKSKRNRMYNFCLISILIFMIQLVILLFLLISLS